jgi:hypothetical protein
MERKMGIDRNSGGGGGAAAAAGGDDDTGGGGGDEDTGFETGAFSPDDFSISARVARCITAGRELLSNVAEAQRNVRAALADAMQHRDLEGLQSALEMAIELGLESEKVTTLSRPAGGLQRLF